MKRRVAFLLIVVLAGCGGGGGNVAPAGKTLSGGSGTAQTSVRIAIPKPTTTAANARKPAFVSPNTNGIAIVVYAHADLAHAHLLASTVVDISSGSSACTTQPDGSRLCTVPIPAPPSAAGDSTDFVFTNYDLAPVSGAIPGGAHALGTATANETIVAGTSSVVSVTLGGIVASVNVLPFNPNPIGSRATSQVLVVALDGSGATIIGPDPYAAPLTLTSNAATLTLTNTPSGGSATVAAASVTINAPTDTIRYAYTGDVNNGATAGSISLTLAGAPAPVVATLAATPSGTITEYGGALVEPLYITAGPDGKLWFTELGNGKIGTITTAGTITEYGGSLTYPYGITAGPDGNLWFTEFGEEVGAIATTGTITVYGGSSLHATGITVGPDGNLWFTESGSGKIGKITTAGAFTEYGGSLSLPTDITAGPDGNLWFTENGNGKIGTITTAGTISEYGGSLVQPLDITAGPDGNLWFTEQGFFNSGKIGRISTAGTITEYGGTLSYPFGITAGPDGNLWFTEDVVSGKIGKITTAGTITEYGGTLSFPAGIAAGPAGNLWFAEEGSGKIVEIVP